MRSQMISTAVICHLNLLICHFELGRLSPAAVAHFYEFEDVLGAMNLSFLQSYDLHLLLTVLQNSQLRLPVQQVKHLHTHNHFSKLLQGTKNDFRLIRR